jgi:hypothetical protein
MDEAMLNQGFSVLQSRFGDQLPGDMLKGEVAMRQALIDQLKVDESTADKLVKQFAQIGWIRFRGGTADTADDTATGFGGDAGAGDGGAMPEGWRDSRVADADRPGADALLGVPLVAASSSMGIQQTGNQGTGGAGGAVVAGAAAAELARGRDEPGERPDPDRDENQVSSEAADHAQASVRSSGYWQLSGPPGAATP